MIPAKRGKVFYLDTCSTCKRIIREMDADGRGFILLDIRSSPISSDQLEELKKKAGSYQALFNRRSRKFRQMGLQDKVLGEKDYRDLILKEDTFLKRPVILLNDLIFAGSDKKTLNELRKALS
ncbi:MAG TPA: ArsC/Spx/MgsR family protein [Chitinophagaceae bacterium]|nr:ArsC/Spx/MgsR family protein [Chitinophagaceae bacterium]